MTSFASAADTGRVINKIDIIIDAYSSIRISGLTVDPTPEDLELALMRLEDMAAEWHSRNIQIGYNFEDEPDPNTVSNIPSWCKRAFASNLALSLTPDFGKKDMPMVLFAQAKGAMSNLSGRVAADRINQVQYPNRMARGSGSSQRYNRWARFYRNTGPIPNINKKETIFIGDINDYTVHFDSYLDDAEVITSFDIQLDRGLDLISSSNTDDDVLFRVEATTVIDEFAKTSSQVTIIITTDSGRVKTQRLFFELLPRD